MSRKKPAPPSKVHVDDGRGEAARADALAEELAAFERDRAPAYAGVDDELVEGKPLLDALGDFDGGADEREPLEESELELEPADDEELAEGIAKIHAAPPSEPPPMVRVRWIVPPTEVPAHAHAMLTNGTRTLCFGHRVEGSVYPPADDVPRCPSCTSTLEGLRKAAAHE